MKKRTAKLVALICTMALALTCIFALVACGGDGGKSTGKGTKYTFTETNVEMTMNGEAMDSSSTAGTKNMYDTMYKDSTITVSDSKIVWKMSDQESTMSVKKDGEKYKLSGDYVENIKKGLSAMNTPGADVTYDFDMYGLKTEGGFQIVIATSTTTAAAQGQTYTSSTTITLNFA